MFSLLLIFSLLDFGACLQVVETSYGKLRGISDFSSPDNHKHSFKGVPFTEPPLGDLRFQLPQPPKPWSGVLDASKYQPGCMSDLTGILEEYRKSEDCLYMNIFTSDRCLKKSCPVIVFFHGGAFTSALSTMIPAKSILDRYVENDIVFVVPTFRLGVFGQFYLGDANVTHPNLLIYDCLAALQFIHKEIKNFGGDPDDVTLMGHSSGGSLVDAFGFSPEIDRNKELFQKLMVLSAFGTFGLEDIQVENSLLIAQRLGCESESKHEVVKCMQQVDAQTLIDAQITMEKNDFLYFKYLLLHEPLIRGNGTIASLKKNVVPRDMLYGVTEHEFESFAYDNYYVTGFFLDFENPVDVTMTYWNNTFNTSAEFVNPDSSAVYIAASTYSQAMLDAGGSVYLYETRQKPYSMHTSDVRFFMGTQGVTPWTDDMRILDTFYYQMLVNFTKYGDPLPNWEKLDPSKMNFLVLEVDTEMGIVPHMEDGFHEELVDYWLINMTELDRDITKQKQQNGEPVTVKMTTKHNPMITVTEKATSKRPTTILVPILVSNNQPLVPEPTEPVVLDETSSIYKQWWFYVVIVFVVLVIIFLCIVLCRPKKEEEQQLLG